MWLIFACKRCRYKVAAVCISSNLWFNELAPYSQAHMNSGTVERRPYAYEEDAECRVAGGRQLCHNIPFSARKIGKVAAYLKSKTRNTSVLPPTRMHMTHRHKKYNTSPADAAVYLHAVRCSYALCCFPRLSVYSAENWVDLIHKSPSVSHILQTVSLWRSRFSSMPSKFAYHLQRIFPFYGIAFLFLYVYISLFFFFVYIFVCILWISGWECGTPLVGRSG